MNRLALIAATGFLALTLTACGEQGNQPKSGTNESTAVTQPAPSQEQPAGENKAPEGQNQ